MLDRVKIIVSMLIFCGFILHFVPDNISRYAFECVTLFAICIYILGTFTSGNVDFEFDKKSAYSKLEYYTNYVESSQKKLFDDIAAKEKIYETN